MARSFLIACALALSSPLAPGYAQEDTTAVNADTPAPLSMADSTVRETFATPGHEAARTSAQETLSFFWQAFARNAPIDTGFMVLVPVAIPNPEDGGPKVEDVWVRGLTLTPGGGQGTLQNRPKHVAMERRATINFSTEHITDWAFFRHTSAGEDAEGYLLGAYTLRLGAPKGDALSQSMLDNLLSLDPLALVPPPHEE